MEVLVQQSERILFQEEVPLRIHMFLLPFGHLEAFRLKSKASHYSRP